MWNKFSGRIFAIFIAAIAVYVFHEIFYIRILFGISLSILVILIILFFIRLSRTIRLNRMEEIETEKEELNEYKPVVERAVEKVFLSFEEQNIIILDELFDSIGEDASGFFFNIRGLLFLKEKTPVINIIEKGSVKASYRLDNFDSEDFSDKFLFVSGKGKYSRGVARLNFDGVIVEHPIDADDSLFNKLDRAAYRFETYYVDSDNNEKARSFMQRTEGMDIDSKGLVKAGHITPANYRCVGICRSCKDTFVFKALNFPMAHCEPVYSDDGQTTAKLSVVPKDKNNWSITLNNITFRYYNSFCCPHCGAPYIDYDNHRELKKFGNLGCVHLNKEEMQISALSELSNENADLLDIMARDAKKIL